MRMRDIVRRAGQNLRQAKGRTILTSLAIGVGAFTIALAMAAGNGGRAYTEEMVSMSGDLHSFSVYPKYEQPEATSNELPEYGVEAEEVVEAGRRNLTDEDITKLQQIDGVESVRPMLYVDSLYVTRGESYKKRVVELSVKVDRTEMKLAAGVLVDNMPRPGEVVVPEGFLSALGFENADSAIGERLYIAPSPGMSGSEEADIREFAYTIAAVDMPGDTVLYYQETIQISGDDAKEMYEYQRGAEAADEYYGVTVLVEQTADMDRLQQEIRDQGYEAYSLQDMREQLMMMINVAQWGLAGFGALAILASIFGIINTQYISVLERTQQIGLMKALGMRRRDVGRLFKLEAAWIGFLGGAIGVLLAWIVTLCNPMIATFLELEEGTRLLRIDWTSSIILIVALMIIAVMSGHFPSRKAAKLDPIEALRTE